MHGCTSASVFIFVPRKKNNYEFRFSLVIKISDLKIFYLNQVSFIGILLKENRFVIKLVFFVAKETTCVINIWSQTPCQKSIRRNETHLPSIHWNYRISGAIICIIPFKICDERKVNMARSNLSMKNVNLSIAFFMSF